MFPTPPSLEQHPAFSPITPYRDTPSQETPAPTGLTDHLPTLASVHLTEYMSEMEEGAASPRQDDFKVDSFSILINRSNHFQNYLCIHINISENETSKEMYLYVYVCIDIDRYSRLKIEDSH